MQSSTLKRLAVGCDVAAMDLTPDSLQDLCEALETCAL